MKYPVFLDNVNKYNIGVMPSMKTTYERGQMPGMVSLAPGDLFYNIKDGKLFTRGQQNDIIEVSRKPNLKNRIINGDFSVWQSGTIWSSTPSTVIWAADMWKISNWTDGTNDVFRAIDTNESGLKIVVDTPATLSGDDYNYGFAYKMESFDCFDLNNKFLTISFRIKTNFSGTLTTALNNHDRTRHYVSPFEVTEGWNNISRTIRLEEATVLSNENVVGLYFSIASDGVGSTTTSTPEVWSDGNCSSAVNSYHWTEQAGASLKIAEVQIEEGKIATDFEHAYVSDQWDRCERYYCILGGEAVGTKGWQYADGATTGMLGCAPQFQTRMRAAPTITIGGAPSYENCVSNILLSWPKGFTHQVTTSAAGNYRIGRDVIYYCDARL